MKNSDRGSSGSPRFGQEAALQLLIFGSWMIAFGAAALLEYAPNASLWFPPAAVTFGSVLVLGWRALPVLWLGCVVVTILADQFYYRGLAWSELLLAGLLFAGTHTLVYGAAAMTLRACSNAMDLHYNLRFATWFLLGGAAAAALSSILGGLALAATGMTDFQTLPALIATWSIGDYAGLVTVAPLFTLLLMRIAEAMQVIPSGGWRRFLAPGARWAGITALGVFGFTVLLALAAATTDLRAHALVLQSVVISVAILAYLALAGLFESRCKIGNH